MLLGILSAIALSVGGLTTAYDLSEEDRMLAAEQQEAVVEVAIIEEDSENADTADSF